MEPTPPPEEESGPPRAPLGQVLFDEIFLFFMLSLVISFMVYNVWGLMEVLRVPLSP